MTTVDQLSRDDVFDLERLAALADQHILDTPPEPEFDDIVQLASKFCETPVALVSLVERDRQWFKARVGFAPCETTIDQSICAFALKEEKLLVIPDLLLDGRTRSNALVAGEPYLRFYAGAVLRTAEGVALGSLCVIDAKPRPDGLTPAQTDALLALARQTVSIMSMRSAVAARAQALDKERDARLRSVDIAHALQMDRERLKLEESRLRLAQESGGIGTFDIDVASDQCFVSAEFCRIFGLPVMPDHPAEYWQALVHEDDRRVITTRQARVDGSASRYVEFRIRRGHDAAVRWIGRRAEFLADDTGAIYRMAGVVEDITERKVVETRRVALIALGDRLREATNVQDVVKTVGHIIGKTLDVDRAGYCMIDVRGEVITVENDWTSEGLATIAGRYQTAMIAKTVASLQQGSSIVVANVPAADWMDADRAWFVDIGIKAKITVPIIDHGKLVGLVFAHCQTPRTWTPGDVDFVQTVADRSHAIIARIEAEAHQKILNEELSHRLKNTLSMVQAIATQTLRGVTEKGLVRDFEDRIIALSRAHDVLLQQSWTAARIGAVVESVLDLHGRGAQVDRQGPDLVLGPKATLSLSLLLHELGTNAIKYGALSCDHGRIDLSWRVAPYEGVLTLFLDWTERGGPAAIAPTRRGFGSRLIAMGIGGTGNAKLNYSQSGLHAEFRAALSAVSEI